MSRNVNKIFFADLEILDLTNLTHCLGVLLSLNTRQAGHQNSVCRHSESSNARRFHAINECLKHITKVIPSQFGQSIVVGLP